MKIVRLWVIFFLTIACGMAQTPQVERPLTPQTMPMPPQAPSRTIVPHFDGAKGLFEAENFINPLTYNNPSYPQLQPWIFRNVVTRRFNHNDFLYGASIGVDYQHGGGNFMNQDTLLHSKAVDGNFENITDLTLTLNSNTDVQDGGTLGLTTTHYGHGDSVMFTATTNATGPSRGTDEGNRVFRVFSQFHGNNYGINVATLKVDAYGQAIMTAPKRADGVAIASPDHDLLASMENGPLLNTNPSKVYAVGDVAEVEVCPDAPPSAHSYMCVTGDAATRWSERYGVSNVTTLTHDLSDISADGEHPADRFAAGPVCADIQIASTRSFKVGGLFTISSGGDNFEQPAVLAVGSGTIHACFAKPHAAREIVSTGGAVGHALSFPNDDIAPRAIPGIDNVNPSTLRLGYPIVASLPGNVLMVWVNPAGSGGQPELKSRSFAANVPMVAASFTPVLDEKTHGIASWTITEGGSYQTRSKTHEGADILPPPALSFAGSTCTVLPVAHTVYTETGAQAAVKPVTDKPGNCSSVKVSVQQSYPNPVRIYPMLWARSNRDPDFAGSEALTVRGINASTNGYMVAGGASPDFAVGDPIEFGYWWQQYISSDIRMSTWMNKSRSYGSYFNLAFDGMYKSALMHIGNVTNAADYYGTPESGFTPGLHGEGRMAPPIGLQLSGALQYGLLMQMPRPRSGTTEDAGGLRFECGFGPCSRGNWNRYDWINAQGKDGDQAGLRFDPNTHNLTFYDYQNGLFLAPAGIGTRFLRTADPGGTISVDSVKQNDGKGGLRAGTLQLTGASNLPCDPDHRFMQNPVPGGPGVADSYVVCLKDAQDQYAWRVLGIVR